MPADRETSQSPMGGRHSSSIQQYFVLEPRRLRRALPGRAQLPEQPQYYATGPSGDVEVVPHLATTDPATNRTPRLHRTHSAVPPRSTATEPAAAEPAPASRTAHGLAPALPQDPLATPEYDGYPSWFRSYVTLEAEARAIQEFEVQVVPGLFQTEDYARAVLRTAWPPRPLAETERRVRARLARQEILDRDEPPLLTVVLDEGVLRRPVGGAGVMADQLRHLVEVAHRPHVKLHVLTYEQSATAPLHSAFVLLELPRQERLAYAEGGGTGRLLPGAEDVDRLAHTFQAMRGEALSASESVALLDRVRRRLYER